MKLMRNKDQNEKPGGEMFVIGSTQSSMPTKYNN
jgi:hypothetical protein